MKILDFKDKKKFIVFGDIHGEFDTFFNTVRNMLKHKIKEEKEKHEIELGETEPMRPRLFGGYTSKHRNLTTNITKSVIFVCGDCGIGFNKQQYYIDKFKSINEVLEKNKVHILFIRGNHDDPSYFVEDKLNFSNIQCIDDYTVVNVNNENILCVGGGISIDRIWRKQQENVINKYKKDNKKHLYWENEAPYLNNEIFEELNKSNIIINHVITHDAPTFAEPKEKETSIEWFKIDNKLNDDISLSRGVMDSIFNKLCENKHKLLTWTYGHYHMSFNNMIGDNEEKTLFICLSENEHCLPNDTYKLLNVKKEYSKKDIDSFYDILKSHLNEIRPISVNLDGVGDVEAVVANEYFQARPMDNEVLHAVRNEVDEQILNF